MICCRYEKKLAGEREKSVKVKTDKQQLKKQYNKLQKEVDDQKELNRTIEAKKLELEQIIEGLKKDISGLRKEVCNSFDLTGGVSSVIAVAFTVVVEVCCP